MEDSMAQCARPVCQKAALNRCSICLKEPYCSGECQKLDWKVHKLICKTLKKFSNQLEPYSEVYQRIIEIRDSPVNIREIRIVRHVISYAEYQFGNRVSGKAYRERGNGERIDNWTVEIAAFLPIYSALVAGYGSDYSLSMMVSINLKLIYRRKILELLRPWSLDDSLDRNKTNFVLWLLSENERGCSLDLGNSLQYSLAEDHSKRALSYARRFDGEGDKKVELIVDALKQSCNLRGLQGDFASAITFAEEAYNYAAVAYNPVHELVQEAAGMLIQSLTHAGNLKDAETYAQVTLDNLRDPANNVDQEGEEVANGCVNLAKVIFELKEDHAKAEMLARKSLLIRVKVHGNKDPHVRQSASLLCTILREQKKLGDETKRLHERCLANAMWNEGPDGLATAEANDDLGGYYYILSRTNLPVCTIKDHLVLSQSFFKEAIRIYTKVNGAAHLTTIEAKESIYVVSHELSEVLTGLLRAF